MKHIILDQKNYEENGTVYKRIAIRGIIAKNDKYLMIFSKHGDYKFPGGGSDEGESHIDSLLREVREETGYEVIVDSMKEAYHVLEKRKGKPEDLLVMDSFYYYCEVKEDTVERDLDEYEKEYDYQVIWETLERAIDKNQKGLDLDKVPWIERETKIMKSILETLK